MRILFFFKNSESLGIEYLSAILKKAGHKTDLLFDIGGDEFGFKFLEFFSLLNFQVIDEKINNFKPDLIAFSAFTNLFPWISNIAQYIKKKYQIPILIGGPHPTQAPDFVISRDFVDFICVGEGDHAILPFINALEKKKDYDSVPGIWYKENGITKKNPPGQLIQNLDEIPFPDKDLFFKYGAFTDRYFILTQRGCPNNCSYCIEHQIHRIYAGQKYIRRRSAKNVVEELLWAKNRYKIKHIHFSDDDFFLDTKWIEDFVNEYKKAKLNFDFKILVNSNNVNKKKVSLIKSIGCNLIAMGIESGSERIRYQVLRRRISNEIILNSAKIIKNQRISLDTLNIINIPNEIPQDMLKTIILNRKIRPNGYHIVNMYPFPNTDMTNMCLEKSLIDKDLYAHILSGDPKFREEAIIKHPFQALGEQIRLYSFLYVKGPNWLRKLCFYLPKIQPLRNIHAFFLTSPKNMFKKAYDVLILAIRTRSYYINKLFIQK